MQKSEFRGFLNDFLNSLQARTHQLLSSNQQLLEHIRSLVLQLVELETRLEPSAESSASQVREMLTSLPQVGNCLRKHHATLDVHGYWLWFLCNFLCYSLPFYHAARAVNQTMMTISKSDVSEMVQYQYGMVNSGNCSYLWWISLLNQHSCSFCELAP